MFLNNVVCALSLCLADAPEAPEKVEALETTYSSIKFRWTAPKDGGRSKIFVYYLTATHPNGTITGRNYSTPTTDPVLEYTFSYLQRDSNYPISVSGYNLVGQGKVRTATFRTVPYKAPGKNNRHSLYNVAFNDSIGFKFLKEWV